MVVRLESLRVEAALDASAYVAGARAKVAADTAMVESAHAVDNAERQVGAAVQQTDRRLAESVPAVERLKRAHIEGYRATQDHEKALGAWKRALDSETVMRTLVVAAASAAFLLPPGEHRS